MKSLIWKQWRESKFLLGMFIGWMVLMVCYSLAYEFGHHYRATVGHFSGLTLFYAMIAAIILASRVSRGEQTDGTFAFMASLPISMRRIATVRIVGAVATLAIPVLLAACILSVALVSGLVEQVEPRGLDYVQIKNRATATTLTSLEQLWAVSMISIFGAVELLLVLSLCGCRLRNQAQVGLLGAVMALVWLIAAGALWSNMPSPHLQFQRLVYGAVFPSSLVIHWGFGEETGGYTDHELAQYRWWALTLAIPLLATLARLFIYQYGRLPGSATGINWRHVKFIIPTLASRLPLRLPNRLIAMIWLEFRQSFPLAFCGLLFAVLFTAMELPFDHSHPGHDFSTRMNMSLPGSMFAVGMLWAVVVGSGIYSADLGSKLGNFWRSRPIPTTLWFWGKFVIGLVAVLVVLDVTTILVTWNAPRVSPTTGMSWAYVACFPIIHALMYSLAVLGTCLFRRPVIGGVLAVLWFTIGMATIAAFPQTMKWDIMHIYNALLAAERKGDVDFMKHSYPLVYGTLAASVVVFALLAYRFAKPLTAKFRFG